MRWLLEAVGYINMILVAVALGFALAWPRHRVRSLLSSCLIVLLLTMVVFHTSHLLSRFRVIEWNSGTAQALQVLGVLSGLLGYALLMAFVIVARRSHRGPVETVPAPQGEYRLNLSPEQRRAILHRREWTYLLDITILSVVNFIIGLAIGLGSGPYGNPQGPAMLVGMVIASVYCLFKDSFNGKSLGKAMTGLRVVDVHTGQPIGVGQSIARNWIFLVPLLPLVEMIVANSREDKRRLGDQMANTVVVRD